MAVFRYNTTDISISAPLDYTYMRKIETPLFIGWHRVGFTATELTEEQSAGNSLLFYLSQLAESKAPVSWTMVETRTVVEDRIPHHYTEASLIQKLEDAGIGRPSTFSSIVETIQERGYVKRTNLPGIKGQCVDWKLRSSDSIIEKTETEKIFGAEKDKLVIQPTGLIALEFLLAHFDDCFSYGYTKTMEETLDHIAALCPEDAENEWHLICREVHSMINERSKELAAKHIKPTFPLADTADYVLVFSSFGASLKRLSDDGDKSKKYIRVKPEIELDLECAKRGEYTFAELAWRTDDGCLGTYNGSNLYLKRGKFGLYAEWGNGKRMSMKVLEERGMESHEIQLEDVVEIIEAKDAAALSLEKAKTDFLPQDCGDELDKIAAPVSLKKTVLRELRPDLSIRKGKFGAYIYYKSAKMDTPEFYPLKPIVKQWQSMDNLQLITWIENTYRPGK